jgi:hypothetical protein
MRRPEMSRNRNEAVANLLASVFGGLVGELLTGWLVRLGVKPTAAGAGVAAVGGAGAVILPGRLSYLSGGAAAVSASRLALDFMAAWGEVTREHAEVEPEIEGDYRSAGCRNNSSDWCESVAGLVDADDDEPSDDSGDLEDDEIIAVIREELGEPEILVPFRNAGIAPNRWRWPAWAPVAALVGLALVPLVLQRIAG